MLAKRLPDDRALLFRMLDETTQLLAKVTETQHSMAEFRKLHQSQEAKEALGIAQKSIELLKAGKPPLVAPARLKVLYPVLDRLAVVNQKLTRLSDSLEPPLLLTSDYLDIPRDPPAFGAWLREKAANADVFFALTQPLRELHNAILEKLEKEPSQVNTTAFQPNGSTERDLTPPARAVAAAYDLKREGKPVSLRAACERAKVDRANLRKRYPQVVKVIEGMSLADRAPRRGFRDRRTGSPDAVDYDSEE